MSGQGVVQWYSGTVCVVQGVVLLYGGTMSGAVSDTVVQYMVQRVVQWYSICGAGSGTVVWWGTVSDTVRSL